MNSENRLANLLSAERAEQPSSATVEHGLRSLRASLGGGTPGLSVAHGPLKLGASLVAKWSVGSGLLVVAALSAVSVVSSRLAASAPSVVRPITVAAATRQTVSAPVPSAAVLEAAPAATPDAPARVGSSAPASSATFAEELKLIKASKQDLDTGRLESAAALLGEHARLYPDGVFSSERQALSVLLACRRSPALGAASARRFVARLPSSPFVDRISRACGLGSTNVVERGSAPAASANFPESADDK